MLAPDHAAGIGTVDISTTDRNLVDDLHRNAVKFFVDNLTCRSAAVERTPEESPGLATYRVRDYAQNDDLGARDVPLSVDFGG